jgi:hypothetical protein
VGAVFLATFLDRIDSPSPWEHLYKRAIPAIRSQMLPNLAIPCGAFDRAFQGFIVHNVQN